ncbi:P-loop nucleoside triphosphate hydrolase superfamily protein [Pelomyxa schiedti]|nr:P-loop nucleoside triphosphate hydrolase superfamily protein [Pelomyxa schiedti]
MGSLNRKLTCEPDPPNLVSSGLNPTPHSAPAPTAPPRGTAPPLPSAPATTTAPQTHVLPAAQPQSAVRPTASPGMPGRSTSTTTVTNCHCHQGGHTPPREHFAQGGGSRCWGAAAASAWRILCAHADGNPAMELPPRQPAAAIPLDAPSRPEYVTARPAEDPPCPELPVTTWPTAVPTLRAVVSRIAFTRSSIFSTFNDKSSLESLICTLRCNPSYIYKVPPIRVTEFKGQWYSLDNRRLYCYKLADIPHAPAIVVPVTERFIDSLLQPTHLDSASIRVCHSNFACYVPPQCSSLHWMLSLNLEDTKQFLNKIVPLALEFPSVEIYSSQWFWPFAEEYRTVLSNAVKHPQKWCSVKVMGVQGSSPFHILTLEGNCDLHLSDFVLIGNSNRPSLRLCGIVERIPVNMEKRDQIEHYEIMFAAPDMRAFLDCGTFPQMWQVARVASLSRFRGIFEVLLAMYSHDFTALEDPILAHILRPSLYKNVVGSNPNERILSQIKAINYATSSDPVAIIHGAGKTTLIFGLLSVLLSRNERVVLCSPSCIALEDIAVNILNNCSPIIGDDISMVLVDYEEGKDLDSVVGTVLLGNVIRVLCGFFKNLCLACADLLFLLKIKAPIDSVHPHLISASSILKGCEKTYIKFKRHFKGTLYNWLTQMQKLQFVRGSLTGDKNTASEVLRECSLQLQDIQSKNIMLEIREELLSSQLILSPLNSTDSLDKLASRTFGTIIIDECDQSLEPEIMLPILRFGARRLILLGDWNQLPTPIGSELAKGVNYGRSMIERMVDAGHHYHSLSIQYRMHPLISAFVSEQFYQNKIEDAPNCQSERSRPWHSDTMFGPLKFFHVDGAESYNSTSQSFSNSYESHFIKYLAKLFFKQHTKEQVSLAVITPYSEQCGALKQLLHGVGHHIEVTTFDGYKGREKDIVIVSTVRSNVCDYMGFLKDWRRLNVVLTRARLALWVVGNACSLRQHPIWNEYIVFARNHDAYIDVRSFPIPMQLRVALGYLSPADLKNFGGPWLMHARDQFYQDLRKLDAVQRTIVGLHLVQLCQGRWPKHPVTLPSSIRPLQLNSIIHLSHTCGKVLIWCIDIEVSESDGAWQIISVFGLVSQDSVEKAIVSLQATILDDGRRSGLRLKLRKTPPYQVPSEGSQKLNMFPQCWDANQITLEQNEYRKHPLRLDAPLKDMDSTLRDVFCSKYFKVDPQFIASVLEGTFHTLPMSLSVKERELVSRDGPIVVCGRSGTGKTTVLLYRMLLRELQSPAMHPRQIFVSVSPSLCALAQNELQSLLSKHGTTKTMHQYAVIQDISFEELEKGISLSTLPESIQELRDSHFPLFITHRKLLTMIDAALQRPFRSSLDKDTRLWHDEIGAPLLELLQPNKKQAETMPNYVADQSVVALLKTESTDLTPCPPQVYMAAKTASTRKFELQEVDFTRFSQEYWVHLDQNLTAGLDSAIVWIEIQSTIKGNVLAILPTKKCLTLEQYCEICTRRTAIIKDPRKVYELFLKYEKEKRLQNGWDMADFTLHVYHQLQLNPTDLLPLDFVYVDEVQDCNMAQLALLKFICPQPSGYALVGDTAQIINQGVNFRFETAKDIFYEILVGKNPREVPQLLFLTRNYRTHAGICNLANVITETIIQFFPHSMDKLPPESAPGSGNPKPIFLQGGIASGTLSQLFRFDRKVPHISFGAGQVMLVRNQEAKKKILEQMESGLVMTIQEAKGLEFNHVLLVNFWHDSIALHQWGAFVNLLKKEEKPTILEDQLLILCSELKHLYTAVTRTRKLLVIVDDFLGEQRKFTDYLAQKGVISLQDTLTPDQMYELTRESHTSPEVWKCTGFQMMMKGMYAEAASCFHFAGDVCGEEKAISMKLVKEGKSSGNATVRKEKFLLASQSCQLDGDQQGQAKCLEFAEEYLEAAEVYQAINDTQSAVNCLISASRPDLAFDMQKSKSMEEAMDIAIFFCSKASVQHVRKEHIDILRKKAFDVLNSTPALVQREEYQRFVRNSALVFKTTRSMEDMTMALMLLSATERLQFLKRYNFFDLIIEEYLRQGKYVQAAEILAREFKYEEAGKLFIRAAEKVSSSEKQMLVERGSRCLFYASYSDQECKKTLLHEAYNLTLKTSNRAFACELKVRLAHLDMLPITLDFEKQVNEEFPENFLLQKLLSDLSISTALKQCCQGISFDERIQILKKWGSHMAEFIQSAHQWHRLVPVYGEKESKLRKNIQDYYLVHQCPDGSLKLTDFSWLPLFLQTQSPFLPNHLVFAQAACVALHRGLNLLSDFSKCLFDSGNTIALANLHEALTALCVIWDIYQTIFSVTDNDAFCTQYATNARQSLIAWRNKILSDIVDFLLASPRRPSILPPHRQELIFHAMELWCSPLPTHQIKGFRLALELQAGDILSKWNLAVVPEGDALLWFALANTYDVFNYWFYGVYGMIQYLGSTLLSPVCDCREWLSLAEMVIGCTVGATSWFLVPHKWYTRVMKFQGPTPLFCISMPEQGNLISNLMNLFRTLIERSADADKWIRQEQSYQFWLDVLIAFLVAVFNLPNDSNLFMQAIQLLRTPSFTHRWCQYPCTYYFLQGVLNMSQCSELFQIFFEFACSLYDPLIQIVRTGLPMLRPQYFLPYIKLVEWLPHKSVSSILQPDYYPSQFSRKSIPSGPQPRTTAEPLAKPVELISVRSGTEEPHEAKKEEEHSSQEGQASRITVPAPEVTIKPWIKEKILNWYRRTKQALDDANMSEEEKLEHQYKEILCSRVSAVHGCIPADKVADAGHYSKALADAQKLQSSLFNISNLLNSEVRKLEEKNEGSIEQAQIIDDQLELVDGAKALYSFLSITNAKHNELDLKWLSETTQKAETTMRKMRPRSHTRATAATPANNSAVIGPASVPGPKRKRSKVQLPQAPIIPIHMHQQQQQQRMAIPQNLQLQYYQMAPTMSGAGTVAVQLPNRQFRSPGPHLRDQQQEIDLDQDQDQERLPQMVLGSVTGFDGGLGDVVYADTPPGVDYNDYGAIQGFGYLGNSGSDVGGGMSLHQHLAHGQMIPQVMQPMAVAQKQKKRGRPRQPRQEQPPASVPMFQSIGLQMPQIVALQDQDQQQLCELAAMAQLQQSGAISFGMQDSQSGYPDVSANSSMLIPAPTSSQTQVQTQRFKHHAKQTQQQKHYPQQVRHTSQEVHHVEHEQSSSLPNPLLSDLLMQRPPNGHATKVLTLEHIQRWEGQALSNTQFGDQLECLVKEQYNDTQRYKEPRLLDAVLTGFITFHPEYTTRVITPLIELISNPHGKADFCDVSIFHCIIALFDSPDLGDIEDQGTLEQSVFMTIILCLHNAITSGSLAVPSHNPMFNRAPVLDWLEACLQRNNNAILKPYLKWVFRRPSSEFPHCVCFLLKNKAWINDLHLTTIITQLLVQSPFDSLKVTLCCELLEKLFPSTDPIPKHVPIAIVFEMLENKAWIEEVVKRFPVQIPPWFSRHFLQPILQSGNAEDSTLKLVLEQGSNKAIELAAIVDNCAPNVSKRIIKLWEGMCTSMPTEILLPMLKCYYKLPILFQDMIERIFSGWHARLQPDTTPWKDICSVLLCEGVDGLSPILFSLLCPTDVTAQHPQITQCLVQCIETMSLFRANACLFTANHYNVALHSISNCIKRYTELERKRISSQGYSSVKSLPKNMESIIFDPVCAEFYWSFLNPGKTELCYSALKLLLSIATLQGVTPTPWPPFWADRLSHVISLINENHPLHLRSIAAKLMCTVTSLKTNSEVAQKLCVPVIHYALAHECNGPATVIKTELPLPYKKNLESTNLNESEWLDSSKTILVDVIQTLFDRVDDDTRRRGIEEMKTMLYVSFLDQHHGRELSAPLLNPVALFLLYRLVPKHETWNISAYLEGVVWQLMNPTPHNYPHLQLLQLQVLYTWLSYMHPNGALSGPEQQQQQQQQQQHSSSSSIISRRNNKWEKSFESHLPQLADFVLGHLFPEQQQLPILTTKSSCQTINLCLVILNWMHTHWGDRVNPIIRPLLQSHRHHAPLHPRDAELLDSLLG